MRFEKYQGAGNDFVVVDARGVQLPRNELARRMCDRHFGVGADGLILVARGTQTGLLMRMLNPDGSEAEACGNGLRCFARYATDHNLVTDSSFMVETLAGIREVSVHPGSGETAGGIEVTMGVPRFDPGEIPARIGSVPGPVLGLELQVLDRTIPVNLVSMGNPHAVSFVTDHVDEYPLEYVGPAMEHHEVFPMRVNFEIARVLNRGEIEARVWERGAGETLACGSGACAIAVAARLLGYCDDEVRVHLPGGELIIRWHGRDDEVRLCGPAQRVFSGDWPD